MKISRNLLPLIVTLILGVAALLHGPIAQLPGYHNFADQRTILEVPHFFDVLSNAGFALVAMWGWWQLAPRRHEPAIKDGWAGYGLFLAGLFLTAFGSSFYHLAPDNARLVWDRLPIALACAGLLAGVCGDVSRRNSAVLAGWLSSAAIFSVTWWYRTELAGAGDLRPYLLLQALPIVLIPLWQWIYPVPRSERWAFGGALILYVIAKLAELNDHAIADMLGPISGHTLKHLLASGAAVLIVACLVRRVRASQRQSGVLPATGRPPQTMRLKGVLR